MSDSNRNRPLPPPVSSLRPGAPPVAQQNVAAPTNAAQFSGSTLPPPPPVAIAPVAPPTLRAVSVAPLTQLGTVSPPRVSPTQAGATVGLAQQSVPIMPGAQRQSTLVSAGQSLAGLPVTQRAGRRRKASFFANAGARLAERLQQTRRIPAWMVSFIFHLLLFLILALIRIPGMGGSAITLFLGGGDSVGIAEFELSGGDEAEIESEEPEVFQVSPTPTDLTQMLTMAVPMVSNVADKKQEDVTDLMRIEEPNANFGDVTGESAASILKNGLRGRKSENKADLLSRGGGSAETEDAVEQGLIWLSKQQRSDGSWSLRGPYDDGGVHENTVAATAMALNAFLGAGYHQLEGKYAGNVQRGLKYLTKLQDKEGFFTTGKEQPDQQAYAQAIATITLLEAYGLSNEYKLREPCQKAIQYAEWAQSKLKGWRYQPRTDADLSVTGWFVMALETAKIVGFDVNDQKLQSVNDFLDSVSHRENAAYAYNDLQEPDLTMTAEGLLCRIWLGWPQTHPALIAGVEQLATHIPSELDRVQSIYYWYYATQVLHHFGGEPWSIWNQEMKRVLPAMQEKKGDEKGSWDPGRDLYGVAGGRLYTTCLAIYCLEVYYRHLAIYDTN